jgi:hypothetical protein
MKYIDTFAGQNWVITPAALAVNEGEPANIHGQKWLLVLSGVAIVDMQGTAQDQWNHETLVIFPAFRDPLKYAINQYAIPTPEGIEGTNYHVDFQLIQWAPFAAPSAIVGEIIGYAVDVWRPNSFRTGPDIFTGNLLNNLFDGIQVDVAMYSNFSQLLRVSYNINLFGYIVFTPVQF